MPQTVKVLSVRQPYADLILAGLKWCECRTWRTRHTGTLYIHASKWDGPGEQTPGDGRTGAIIGRVKLVEVVDLEAIDPDDFDAQDRIVIPIAEKHGLPTMPEYSSCGGASDRNGQSRKVLVGGAAWLARRAPVIIGRESLRVPNNSDKEAAHPDDVPHRNQLLF